MIEFLAKEGVSTRTLDVELISTAVEEFGADLGNGRDGIHGTASECGEHSEASQHDGIVVDDENAGRSTPCSISDFALLSCSLWRRDCDDALFVLCLSESANEVIGSRKLCFELELGRAGMKSTHTTSGVSTVGL